MSKPGQLAHPPKHQHIRDIATALIGTCAADPEEMGDWTLEECKEFDSIVFRCEQCGWWESADNCNEDDGWFCDECTEERKA